MTADTASIRKQVENAMKPETPPHQNRCESCNAEFKDERTSLREILLNAICLLIVLATLAPGGYLAVRWIEQHLDRPLWHPLWYEPLDDWSALSGSVDLALRHFTLLSCGTRPQANGPSSLPFCVTRSIHVL